MTKDDIIKLAETQLHRWWLGDEKLEAFYNLAVAAEREACAKLCESHVRYPSRLYFAAAIRARGQA